MSGFWLFGLVFVSGQEEGKMLARKLHVYAEVNSTEKYLLLFTPTASSQLLPNQWGARAVPVVAEDIHRLRGTGA